MKFQRLAREAFGCWNKAQKFRMRVLCFRRIPAGVGSDFYPGDYLPPDDKRAELLVVQRFGSQSERPPFEARAT